MPASSTGASGNAGTMRRGFVSLVGAGPGDPELLTLKGRRRLESADSVLYDELANSELLDLAPARAERFYVGKRCGHHSMSQERIVQLLVERARAGEMVVRLKGGDPFLFGRGAEEAEGLTSAGIDWEVVPGVSAALGATAAAGIPLTRRGVASTVAFLPGHCMSSASDEAPSRSSIAIEAACRADTVAVFMGLSRLPAIVAEFLGAGRNSSTPVAVISHGACADQRVVTGQLDNIAARVTAAELTSPALIVVGDVVTLRERLQPPCARSNDGSLPEVCPISA